jgi:hypothetical protein
MGTGKRRVAAAIALLGALVLLATPASAQAVVTIGPNPLLQRSGVVGEGGARIFTNNVVPAAGLTSAQLTSPIDGVVVRWRVRRGSGGGGMAADTVTLRVLHPTGAVNQFTAVGTSEPHMVPAGSSDPVDVYEYPTRLPIAAGDRVGLGTTVGQATYRNATTASYLVRLSALADGATATFAAGGFPNLYVLVNADVEPDADSDGFGDETQDQCPTDPTTQGVCPDTAVPETTVTKAPKDRTKKRTATFEFISNEPGSTFRCAVDGQALKVPCTSPYRVKVKRGKHTFQVQATDQAGNADGTPATDDWKVKKKRRR